MNSKIPLLAVLLVVQIGLVAVFWPGQNNNAQNQQAWLQVDPDRTDGIILQGDEGEVALTRVDERWQVAGLPADADKVTEILDKLAEIKAPWPVATSASSAARFEVTDDDYQRRVQLIHGSEVQADLYLGTSPSFQRVHARKATDDEIFSIALSNYELSLSSGDWLDKTLLSVTEPVTAVTARLMEEQGVAEQGVAEHRLEHTPEGWLYNGAAADQDAANTYVDRFKTLRVTDLATAEVANAQKLASIELEWREGSKILYIAKLDEDYLISEAEPAIAEHAFKVASYVAEQLLLSDVDLTKAADVEDLENSSEDPS